MIEIAIAVSIIGAVAMFLYLAGESYLDDDRGY